MECMGVMAEGEWSSLNGMYTNEEADFMAQLLNSSPLPNELDGSSSFGVPSSFWPCHEATMNMAGINEGSNYASDIANCNLYNISQGSTYSGVGSILFPSSSQESYYLSDSQPIFISNDSSMSINFCMGDATNTSSFLIEADDCLNQELSDGNVEEFGGKQPEHFLPDQNLQPKNFEMPVMEPSIEDISNNPSENPKKRSRGQGDVQKNKRNVKPKKSQKTVSASNNEDDGNAGLNRQALSSCCSEDDSQDLNGGVSSSTSSKGPGALNLNGKTRASRGSATDPQSLYARKRRERINERLRILQNLVPNGTKVDISTMLEEAVQYVKFLQLQIKMLSSDDLWMYAPLAYNGMNLGLDLKITTPNSS